MDIIFADYTDTDGAFTAHLPLKASVADATDFVSARLGLIAAMTGEQINDGVMSLALPELRAEAFAATGGRIRADNPLQVRWASNTLAPSLAIFTSSLPELTASLTSFETNDGELTGHLLLHSLVTDATAAFRPQLPMSAYFSDGHASTDRIAMLVQQPELVSSMVPGITVSLVDTFHGTDDHAADYIHALMDLIRFSDRYGELAQVLQALHDGIGLADVARLIWEAGLLDTFVASAVQAGTAQITVMLSDSIDLGDTATALSEILAGIADGFYVGLVINTGDDGYTAWVMTPETKAMRSYSNYPFNSYATLGGHFIGACDTGIYRMGGDTDNGAAIRASIRTGLLNFGSLNMKAVNAAYVGATLSGSVLLRVQATTTKGVDLEQTYRMVPAITGKPRQHRQVVGRGFQSVYWTFELANDTDGADFDVTTWHVLPVTLTGRLI